MNRFQPQKRTSSTGGMFGAPPPRPDDLGGLFASAAGSPGGGPNPLAYMLPPASVPGMGDMMRPAREPKAATHRGPVGGWPGSAWPHRPGYGRGFSRREF